MKWNPANDCKLWPYVAGRDVAKFEWPIIAAQFPGTCNYDNARKQT
jgi:hypothetical protein